MGTTPVEGLAGFIGFLGRRYIQLFCTNNGLSTSERYYGVERLPKSTEATPRDGHEYEFRIRRTFWNFSTSSTSYNHESKDYGVYNFKSKYE